MSDGAEAKRVKSSALPWFITSRLRSAKRVGLSEVEQACLALEADGMPCPMAVDPEQWVRENFSYICFKYYEKYPRSTTKPAKKKRKKKHHADRMAQRQATAKPAAQKHVVVAGVDVASDAFLSTFQWRKVRMEALKKYGPRCQCCGATPATGAVMNVDHIKPRKKWPSLALDVNNLQILCHDCNHGKGNWDQTDWRS
jgi:5-methylcytosine-specific restriction endonuclease McrA